MGTKASNTLGSASPADLLVIRATLLANDLALVIPVLEDHTALNTKNPVLIEDAFGQAPVVVIPPGDQIDLAHWPNRVESGRFFNLGFAFRVGVAREAVRVI